MKITSLGKIAFALTTATFLWGSAAHAQSPSALIKKPSYWPSKYVWHDYKKTAPQPAYEGKIEFIKKDEWPEAINFKTLPLQHAIVRVRGNGERKIALFTDPTCPQSTALERTINKLDNVTIYTFVVPVLNNARSRPLSEQIMCQPTNQARAQAYDDLALNRSTPQVVAPCEHAIDQVMQALDGLISPDDGYRYDETSPNIIFENNLILAGAVSLKEFREIMSEK